MRIIGGTQKNRKIVFPKKFPVRSTTDMAREALFNILNSRFFFDDLKVLDLFSGSGLISYEFASREALSVTTVEKNKAVVKFIRKMIHELEFRQMNVVPLDVFDFLDRDLNSYDVIFADPPYDLAEAQYDMLLDKARQRLKDQDSILIIEHAKENTFSFISMAEETRAYGSVQFSFYKK